MQLTRIHGGPVAVAPLMRSITSCIVACAKSQRCCSTLIRATMPSRLQPYEPSLAHPCERIALPCWTRVSM
jgi:hypothetical protein